MNKKKLLDQPKKKKNQLIDTDPRTIHHRFQNKNEKVGTGFDNRAAFFAFLAALLGLAPIGAHNRYTRQSFRHVCFSLLLLLSSVL